MKKRDLLLLIIFVGIIFVSIRVYGAGETPTCDGVIAQGLIDDINKYVFTPIKWLTPIALIILTSIDFAGVVFSGDKKGMDKAKNNFLKRAVAALIIFFAPDLINLIVELVNKPALSSCYEKFGLTK